jgi:hypothetical protein
MNVRKGRVILFAVGAVAIPVLAFRACSRGREGAAIPIHASAGQERGPTSPRPPTAGSPPASGAPSGATSPGSATPPPGAPDRVVFFSPWGGGKDQLGRERPTEGNPEGPMSLAPDHKGRVLVLDQVNGRIVRYGADGKPESPIAVNLTAPQDIAVNSDGSISVLDRNASKAVAIYDESGALRGQIPIQGEGVPEPGLVTGVFTDKNDIYVEREHGPLVRIGDISGRPAEPREEIPGRPSRDGLSFVNAGISDPATGRVYVASTDRAARTHKFTRELRFGMPARSIALLDTDRSGVIYLATVLERAPDTEMVLLSCLEPLKGVPLGKAELPPNTMPEETFRDMVVLDEGGVIYSLRSEQGVTYQVYNCQ